MAGKQRSKTMKVIAGVIWTGVAAIAAIVWFAPDPEQEKKDREAAAKLVADTRKGLHCLDRFDGSNASAVDQIKDALREPSSFEHIETLVYPEYEGSHGAVIKYRARNGFGGMNIETMYARLDHATCKAQLLPDGPGSS